MPVAPPAQVAPPQAQPNQPPLGFQLNPLEQAQLSQVLDAWQLESGRINTFKCSFERWDYNAAFGPAANVPLSKDKGELSFERPDKGSFQIVEINRYQAPPAPQPGQPPQPGNWVKQPDAIGEHWVCDGKSVFEYRHEQKQLVERPIPPQLQGQGIVDGPLPFLFGADAAKLKQRYWMRIEQQHNNANMIWLQVRPRTLADAAEYEQVDVMLDRERKLPSHMNIHLPSGSRHLYIFDLPNASINNALHRFQALFQRPRKPAGWTHIVEQLPQGQAANPVPPPR
jgi:TIGR03009 family protein